MVGERDRIHAIPLPAVCLNVTWELLFALWRPPQGTIRRVLYLLWLLLDLVILAQAFRYAGSSPFAFFRDYPGTTLALGLLASLLLHLVLFQWFQRPYHVAFALNLVMSLLFIHMYYGRPNGLGVSLTVAWLKFLGTSAISVANLLRFRGEWRSERWLGAFIGGSFLFDAIYLALLHFGGTGALPPATTDAGRP